MNLFKKIILLPKNIFLFYYRWLRDMTLFGKTLWKLLVVKVIIIVFFAYFIFPNILNQKYGDDEVWKIEEVSNNILQTN